ncbi:DUF4197 domain-containing protein [Sphingobacterium litopenaei]|uniref:DUF4197 domain-containing protein n=1 Tax=Sphingobacterium litopenaei TaxID=2763500 RepID=A0ABR7YE07_9SPHI|nr:DUF4197 domain-containing protein [Sphingobacterium litopenaei]MBD1429540.1 DUF4197 domain-containing protein [Sphingobacterium litopenaei]
MKTIKYLALGIATLPLFTGCETMSQIASTLPQTAPGTTTSTTGSNSRTITQAEATTGIKQALSNGLQNSINTLSANNGFYGDAIVKILMPQEAQKVEQALRSVGMGKLVDNFVLSLNRAAESAVKEAAPVFVNSLSQMTVTDAFNILLGSQQDAATTFFKRTASATLTQKFSPIVESALGKNNVSSYWTQLTSAYNALPIAKEKVQTDLNAYVTQKAIDGLFTKIAGEELKIRQNIGGARNSSVLESVFGWVDKQK